MSSTPKDATAPAILTHFQSVEDPRQEGSALVPSGSTSFGCDLLLASEFFYHIVIT